MTKIGIIRCEKNANKCPLTSCIRSLSGQKEGFAIYDDSELMGVFTCQCPGDNTVDLSKILKSKGAEAIHFCTCTFAAKKEGQWTEGNGFCDHVDNILENISKNADIQCVKGTAHLPKEYSPKIFK